MVRGRDRTKLAEAMRGQANAVRTAIVGFAEPPVIPVLCFVGPDNWGLLDPSFRIGNVRVLWPRALRTLLELDGPLGGSERVRIARLLSTQLLPAVK